jgi:protein-tyrosine phosphatase
MTVKLKSVLNFRDVGGIPVNDGVFVREGIIFRSASPDRISRKEFGLINELGIGTIFDLRADRERNRRNGELDKIEVITLPLDFEEKTRELLWPLLYKKNPEKEIDAISASLYIEILDASGPVLRSILEKAANCSQGAILIHCQAGKDRTGIIAALIQMALGVGRETIVTEFLKSNDELLPFFRKMLLIRKILRFGFLPSGTILYAIRVKQANIESVIDRVNNHYGGIEQYMANAGIDKDIIAAFRNRMLPGQSLPGDSYL